MGVNVSQTEGGDANNHWIELFKHIQRQELLQIVPQCRVLKLISWNMLWENFLKSECQSFAVNIAELTSLLTESIFDGIEKPPDFVKQIQEYIEFIQELSATINSKYFDFLAVCSSVLMISEDHLELKIDQLFTWIDLNLDNDVSFEEFYLALSSYETGLSYLTGHAPVSSKYMKAVAQVWFSICGFGREDSLKSRIPVADSPSESIGKIKFFEFCTNRQQGARKIIEAFGSASVRADTTGKLQDFGPDLGNREVQVTGGDEWLANPVWKKTAESMTPPDHGAIPTRPSSALQLEWVHGCRGFDCRNNVRYLPGGQSFVFTAASLGVIQTIGNERTQRHFGDHTDDIISISVFTSSSSYTVATGEMGKTPAIHLWDHNLASLACLRGTHTKAVVQLSHSQDGKYLFSVGLEYTVAVYCIEQGSKQFGKQVCSSQGPKSKILHASAFGVGSTSFVTCGEKHICFWNRTPTGITCENVNLARDDKNKVFLSACPIGDSGVVVGAADGSLLFFRAGKLVSSTVMQGKEQSINALWSSLDTPNSFFVGGKQGVIQRFSASGNEMTRTDQWCLAGAPTIRSLCSMNDSKLLVCTLECEIIEMNLTSQRDLQACQGEVLNAGHFKNELWGLAVRPLSQTPQPPFSSEYATVGDDGYLRVFSVKDKKQLYSLDMKAMARCCAYSPDGLLLAVGYGGRVGKGKSSNDGMFRVYRMNYDESGKSIPDPVRIFEARDAKQAITDIKFSADNRILAVGSKDNSIYVYSVPQRFKLKLKFSRHKASITHFDISSDGQYMQSNCGAYELLFCNLQDGKPVLRGTSLMTTNWSTWTCPLGWPVQGIWPACADGTDINAVDRSPCGKLLATADDFGKVKVFRYPAVIEKSEFNQYSGHSSHVTNVRWTPNNPSDGDGVYLISIGGNDKCVFQWKHLEFEDDLKSSTRVKSTSQQRNINEPFTSEDLEDPSGGDEFMAIKPWKGAIKAPSNFGTPDPTRVVQFQAALGEYSSLHASLHSNDSPPTAAMYAQISRAAEVVQNKLIESGFSSREVPDTDELELSWVNGYRGFDSRNNVRYGCGGEAIIYFTASLGIVLFKSPAKQLYFKGHTDDIISMAVYGDVNTNTTYVVTGQMGKGNTYVWSISQRSIVLNSTFQTNQKSINLVEFSHDGRLVISIAEDNTVAVTEWKNQRIIANVAGEPAPTYHICPGNSEKLFLCCGEKFIRVWSLSGRNLTSVKVSTSPKGKPQKFWCAAFFQNNWYVGCEDGSIYTIAGDSTKITGLLVDAGGKEKSGNKKNSTTAAAVTSVGVSMSRELLIFGSKDGTLTIFGASATKLTLSPISIVSIFPRVLFLSPQIQSIACWMNENEVKLLIGTRGCDIIETVCRIEESQESKFSTSSTWEFQPDAMSPLVQGHCNDELWGLAVHPTLPCYITVGDDKTLRHWRLHPEPGQINRQISCTSLGIMARACAFHPKGHIIAVGFGGRVGRGKQKDDGVLRIYQYREVEEAGRRTHKKLFEIKDAKQWISDVKFSPDGTVLAVGSHDNIVFFYAVTISEETGSCSLRLTGKFSKHNSFITHLDFSADGRFLQSNCGAYELLFCDTTTKRQITSATELRDVRWSTWTCTLGWPVQGIWPPGADGTDINGVDRSHSGHLIATSDDFGKIKIFRYPCVTEGADSLLLSGHSSHVMNVRWTVGDEYLITCGGNDKAVFQWKHSTIGIDSSSKGNFAVEERVVSTALEDESSDGGMGEVSGGDEFMAIKPWKGAIRAPELLPSINPAAPSTKLSLHWVHGYTSGSAGAHDTRISSNLFYNSNFDVIYPAAALGVCLHHDRDDTNMKRQSYFHGHNDDILCLTISRCKRYVATGQTASKTSKGKGSICVWDAVECRKLCEMKECHARGVISVSFSPESDKLLSIGLDNNYQHTVWSDVGGSWSRVQQLVSEKSDQKTHLYSRWVPSSSDCHFVSGGATSIHFWKIEGSSLSKKESRSGKYAQKPLLCAATLSMKDSYRLVSGTSSGDLYVFDYDSRECKNAIEGAHEAAILTLAEGTDYQFLISGGMDKCVKIWNHALQPITYYKFDQTPLISPVNASIASVDYRVDGANIVVLVGTIGGEIIEIAANSEQGPKAGLSGNKNFDLMNSSVTVLLQSHYSGELWGLAPHPENNDIVATVSDDGTIRLWDLSTLTMVSCTVVGKPMRSVCWNTAGNLLAVGFGDTSKTTAKKASTKKGKGSDSKSSGASSSGGACSVYLYNAGNHGLQLLASGCPSTAWISDIKFSPLDRFLALASHDKKLYVYSVPNNNTSDEWKSTFKKPKYIFNKHSSAILHIDFTADEKYFQTNCQAYELLFGDATTGTQKTSATELSVYHGQVVEPDQQWSTWTCTLGWPVQGIWQEGIDGSDINAVHRSPHGNLLATAEDSGMVKLFRYPCVQEGSKYDEYSGHSSHVTCVRWTKNQDYLTSVGGNDKCFFIWKVAN